ncbi:epidermal growth factor receptor isoform X1 [Phlebotomus papatasi]|uniref:epidermal growth factor receptor isoform X1 n=1 Tax=Phlebotomus papatasi TaxID=29031 RepID=UPI0024833FB2|nr:epidermal growth factor receptor isoform X1 [Phlebotomus papatasi]
MRGYLFVGLFVLHLAVESLGALERVQRPEGKRFDRPRKHQQHQLTTDLAPKVQQDDKQPSEFVKGKICIGTNGRMSVPSNRDHHYRNLRDRFTNCTYVDGNLELTWLQDTKLDLSFLQNIREVTGYVLISHVDIQQIVLPKLQIIRGRTLFKLNISDQEFGLFVTYSQMHTLEMPSLRDILSGSVGIFNNYNLCHMRTIDWEEIISGPNASMHYMYNFTSPERQCVPCHPSCQAGCWGEGPHNCQQFSKTTCSPQCAQGRCFGPKPRECCHLFCAGGCSGPTQKDCLACRNFYDDGVCKQECPPMQKYNPTNYLWEPNPDGKYAYGATCVRNCPEHLLKDNGACVRTCPPNKMAKNGECVPCNGACPKTCPGQGIVHSGNIDSFRGCTVIEGSLEILEQTFNGYQHVFANFSFGQRFIRLHPDRLEVFSTLKEVTGYINIQADHEHFTNLSYFRNLEVIGGRQLMENYFASLYIVKTSLKSLELQSLKRINSGAVVILENKNLCFAEDIKWNKVKKSTDHDFVVSANRNKTECEIEDQVCSDQCTLTGCWGAGPNQCLECRSYKYNDTCLASCKSLPGIYEVNHTTCGTCHPECKNSCRGAGADNCTECVNVRDGNFCVAKCPESKYSANGICKPCHDTCIGCTGPENTINANGCKTCHKAIINGDATIERCLGRNEACPEGYFSEWVMSQEQGPLRLLANKPICRRCHPRCKKCSGYGFHEHVCQECAGYKRGEQCEDECPTDHYVDEATRECFPCHLECRGCTGPTEAHCSDCRNYKLFGNGDPANNATAFNCTAACPSDFPYQMFDFGPYCSASNVYQLSDDEFMKKILSFVGIVILAITVLIAVGCVWRCCQKQKAKEETVKMTMVLAGCEDSEPLRPSNVGPNLAKLRIVKEAELRRGGILGMGAFGRVFKGVWIPENESVKIPVAIKVLTEMSGSESSKEFLDEAYIMASVEHPNLLKLLAVCMTSQMMLITQLMPLGCLLDYVRTNKDKIGSKALLNWSTQIARGMAYLEERSIVHRDLAARNVLVQTPSCVKITDFGLAKLLDVGTDEYKASGGKMPIKWLALECIRNRVFTSKSDVWAFGVTIWELLTFGARPYEEYSAKEVPEAIEEGYRLKQPDHCSLDIYVILLRCWDVNAEARPHFKDLVQDFADKARDPGRYLSIDGDKFMRLPSYMSQDERNLIQTLAPAMDGPEPIVEAEEYLQPKTRPSVLFPTVEPAEEAPSTLRYCSEPLKNSSGDDETDSHTREVGVGNLRLDLPLDEDDYLMPTCQNGAAAAPGYMDLINVPPSSVDNPEYLMGAAAAAAATPPAANPAPTQTIGIPVAPTEVEAASDHEYYNDLQRELQPLHRSETTV